MFTSAVEVFRRESDFGSQAGLVPAVDPSDPVMGIAMRQLEQRGARPNGLWEVEGMLRMFQTLLRYAVFPVTVAAGPGLVAGPAPEHESQPKLADVFRWFSAALGSRECKPL